MKKRVFKILKPVLALVAAFLAANAICFAYERPVGWIDTPNGASLAVRDPGTILVHGTEGYAVTRIDSFGYTNRDLPLAERYVLMMGASHSQGKEISVEKRYSSIVNDALCGGDAKELRAFNIACDGHFLPTIVKQFRAAVSTYPNADCVTIEIGTTDYAISDLEDALEQTDAELIGAKELFAAQPAKAKLRTFVKNSFPLLSMILSKIETAKQGSSESSPSAFDAEAYRTAVGNCLRLIRSEYDGPIVIVYHPGMVMENGDFAVRPDETAGLFAEECKNAGIVFLSLEREFDALYRSEHLLPYGFSNTSPGKGHLNENGHAAIAKVLLDYLREEGLA